MTATRWRELSLLLGAWWEIFNMSIFVTEMYHQGETKLLTSMVLSCSFLKCLTEKKKMKSDKFGFFLIFALVIQHWMWVLLLDSSHQSDTRVVTTWLVNKMSHRKKNSYGGLYERSYFWKMSKIISIFDQKIGVYEGIFAFWRPGRPLRGQKFYKETSIWSRGYVPKVKE